MLDETLFNAVGHRCGSVDMAGGYQVPALSTGGAVFDLSAWAGQYIRISWFDPDQTAILYYGFFATSALATTGFDKTTVSGAIVPTAPDFLPGNGYVDVTVPLTAPFIRVEGTDTGRCLVRHAEAT